jgi:hypothetical protein
MFLRIQGLYVWIFSLTNGARRLVLGRFSSLFKAYWTILCFKRKTRADFYLRHFLTTLFRPYEVANVVAAHLWHTNKPEYERRVLKTVNESLEYVSIDDTTEEWGEVDSSTSSDLIIDRTTEIF